MSELIRVTKEQKKILQNLKEQHQFKKLNEVIDYLIKLHIELTNVSGCLGFRDIIDFLKFVNQEFNKESILLKETKELLEKLKINDSFVQGLIIELLFKLREGGDPKDLQSFVNELVAKVVEEKKEAEVAKEVAALWC